jgi:carbonic anhydrase
VAEGPRPGTLFVGCADSRILPDVLTDSRPGELFVVRNVGAFVPPWDADSGVDGTAAGIEFATLALDVRDIVVCGHSHCGAIQALYDPPRAEAPHIARWLTLARPAMLDEPMSPDVLRRTEERSIVVQLERLLGYPLVRERVERGELSLHGWYYVIEEGRVFALDLETGAFAAI